MGDDGKLHERCGLGARLPPRSRQESNLFFRLSAALYRMKQPLSSPPANGLVVDVVVEVNVDASPNSDLLLISDLETDGLERCRRDVDR